MGKNLDGSDLSEFLERNLGMDNILPLFTETLINNNPDGILAFNNNYQIILCNPALQQMIQVQQDPLIGKDIFSRFPFLTESGLLSYFNIALQGKTTDFPPL